MNLYQRLQAYVLSNEWSANLMDSRGSRCPECSCQQSDKHTQSCILGNLCADIRTLRRAKELESEE